MKMKNDAKIEENLTCRFKIEMRNLMIFAPSFENIKNLHFNGLLLTKVYMFELKKYRGVMLDCTEDG